MKPIFKIEKTISTAAYLRITEIVEVETLSMEDALELSIHKWNIIVEYIRRKGCYIYDGGTMTCYLCKWALHKARSTSIGDIAVCSLCPVGKHVGYQGCYLTPYWKYSRSVAYHLDESLGAAVEELIFLEGLRDV